MKKYLESGKIVGTHGVRGMIRIQPWCDSPAFLSGFKKIYTNNGDAVWKVKKIQPHGNVVIAQLDGVDTIESAERLRGSVIYIDRNDVKLGEGQYFVDDIIGCEVFSIDTGEKMGTVCDVSATGANDVWHIKRGDKQYLIPKIDSIVKTVDIENNRVEISVMKGLFDDED